MSRFVGIVLIVLLVIPCISNGETIDVQIKGVDDGVKTTKQQDYKEAVLFAKREAIERAGVKVKSLTTAKDFIIYSDYIESKAEAVLLSGYNVIDVGYQTDGIYLVVLVGKVETVQEGIETKELRYAKSLIDNKRNDKANKIIDDIITNSEDDDAVAEAMYCKIVWGLSRGNEEEVYGKLKAYYPDSKYIGQLSTLLGEKEFYREYCKRFPVKGGWGTPNWKRRFGEPSTVGTFIGLDKTKHRIKTEMMLRDSTLMLNLYIDGNLVKNAESKRELLTRKSKKKEIQLNCNFICHSLGERFNVKSYFKFRPQRSSKYAGYWASVSVERLDCPELPDKYKAMLSGSMN